MAKKRNKKPSEKRERGLVWPPAPKPAANGTPAQPAKPKTISSIWKVKWGRLVPRPGRPDKAKPLLKWVGEKIPYEALPATKKLLEKEGAGKEGVYVAHDSMSYARYVGRGDVFKRLAARKKAHPSELAYFSFYIIAEKQHEREIETLLIRLGGAHLQFNERKKRLDTSPGDLRDYEAGTKYVERQRKKGRKKKK